MDLTECWELVLEAQDDKLFGEEGSWPVGCPSPPSDAAAVRVEGRVEDVDGFTCIAEGSQLVGVPGRGRHSLSIS